MLFLRAGRREQAEQYFKCGAAIMIEIAPELHVARGMLPKRELSRFVREAAEAIPLEGDISVLLTTDRAIKNLNREFRGKKKATDVLSFPAGMDGSHAGDLAVSIETAARQAEEFGHSLQDEVRTLLLHGLLHLAGFDHERDAGQMARRERLLRERFGLPIGLIQRTEASPR